MRVVLVTIGLLSVFGVAGVELSAQEGRGIIWHRVCDIEPGQNTTAATFAREVISVVNEKFESGFVTSFQSVTAPFDQIHFLSFTPDLGTWQSQNDSLLADADYQAMVQRATGILDRNSCVDTFARAVP